jgi:alcohol oxidase
MSSRKYDDSGERAIGIEYTANELGLPVFAAKAKKLVVVSAGAFGSPSILERSGIGSSSILERHGIPVIVDLPGVGENYQGMSVELR